MSIRSPEEINIKDLVIEEPTRHAELPFDPERDLTKEDWQEIELEFEKDCRWNTGNSQSALKSGFYLKALSPQRFEGLRSYLNQRKILSDYNAQDYIGHDGYRHWRTFYTAYIKTLFPNLPKTDIKEVDINSVNEFINRNFDPSGYLLSNEERLYKKILFPKESVEYSEQEWNLLVRDLKLRINLNGGSIISEAVRMRMADPAKFKRLEHYLPKLIELARTELENTRIRVYQYPIGHPWRLGHSLLNSAFNLFVLTAEDVQVTEEGLKVKKGKPKFSTDDSTAALPEVRRF